MMNMEETMKMIFYLMFFLALYAFSTTHVMNNLIIIEFTIVSILYFMFKMMMMVATENHMILYFIILAICESMVGLSLMIAMIRTHGNDYLKSTNTMKF